MLASETHAHDPCARHPRHGCGAASGRRGVRRNLHAYLVIPIEGVEVTDEGQWRACPQGRGILAGIAPSFYHLPNFSPRLPHPSDVLRVERLSKEREADEETVKAELEPSFGDPQRKA